MDTLRRLYTVVVQRISARLERKYQQREEQPHKFKVNDMVLVKDPDAAVFRTKIPTELQGDSNFWQQQNRGSGRTRTQVSKKICAREIHSSK